MSKKKRSEPVDENINKQTQSTDNKIDNESASTNSNQQQKSGPTPAGETPPDNVCGDIDKPSEKEVVLQEKLAEMQDKYIRLSAEFDNFRKRTLKEKMDLSKYAGEEVLIKTLPLVDDFERALDAMEKSSDEEALKTGVALIYNKFQAFLSQSGVKEIESLNCPFNFDIHDAVAKVAVEETDKKGKIIDVIQKGYFLKDKVIRHSKVVVGE